MIIVIARIITIIIKDQIQGSLCSLKRLKMPMGPDAISLCRKWINLKEQIHFSPVSMYMHVLKSEREIFSLSSSISLSSVSMRRYPSYIPLTPVLSATSAVWPAGHTPHSGQHSGQPSGHLRLAILVWLSFSPTLHWEGDPLDCCPARHLRL